MKRNWNDADLSEHWFLFPPERQLLGNKTGSTRLGFAILLKFFQLEGRFPDSPREVPGAAVTYMAGQVGVPAEVWGSYPWEGATIKRHRIEIRDWCGFREITNADLDGLKRWLVVEAIPEGYRPESIAEILMQRCKALSIEPPASSHANRLIQSAFQEHETGFCEGVFQSLNRETVARLDALLIVQKASPETEDGVDWTPWQSIKSEPGKAGVASVMEATARLRLVREVGLPVDIFKGISPKLLERYAQRAAVEEPHELRRHNVPLNRPRSWRRTFTAGARI